MPTHQWQSRVDMPNDSPQMPQNPAFRVLFLLFYCMSFSMTFFIVLNVWHFSMVFPEPIRFVCRGRVLSFIFGFFSSVYQVGFKCDVSFVFNSGDAALSSTPPGFHYLCFGSAVERPTLALHALVSDSSPAF